MMGFRIGSLGWSPVLHVLSDQLGRKLGVAFLVKSFSFLTSFVLTNAINVDSATAELAQEFGREDHASKISNWYQV